MVSEKKKVYLQSEKIGKKDIREKMPILDYFELAQNRYQKFFLDMGNKANLGPLFAEVHDHYFGNEG